MIFNLPQSWLGYTQQQQQQHRIASSYYQHQSFCCWEKLVHYTALIQVPKRALILVLFFHNTWDWLVTADKSMLHQHRPPPHLPVFSSAHTTHQYSIYHQPPSLIILPIIYTVLYCTRIFTSLKVLHFFILVSGNFKKRWMYNIPLPNTFMAPYSHQFSMVQKMGQICIIFGAKFGIMIDKINTKTGSSKGAIWDAFSEQHQQ